LDARESDRGARVEWIPPDHCRTRPPRGTPRANTFLIFFVCQASSNAHSHTESFVPEKAQRGRFVKGLKRDHREDVEFSTFSFWDAESGRIDNSGCSDGMGVATML
jgi:hypothetical protein